MSTLVLSMTAAESEVFIIYWWVSLFHQVTLTPITPTRWVSVDLMHCTHSNIFSERAAGAGTYWFWWAINIQKYSQYWIFYFYQSFLLMVSWKSLLSHSVSLDASGPNWALTEWASCSALSVFSIGYSVSEKRLCSDWKQHQEHSVCTGVQQVQMSRWNTNQDVQFEIPESIYSVLSTL